MRRAKGPDSGLIQVAAAKGRYLYPNAVSQQKTRLG
jgi:hypothetical protein